MRRIRRVQDSNSHLQPSIEDYSVIVSNISQTTNSDQLLEKIQQTTQAQVVSYLRINNPSILKQKMKFIKRQKEFYDELKYNSESIINVKSKLYYYIEKVPLLFRLLQACGLYHDAKWYDSKLREMKHQIELKVLKKEKEKEGVIISFQTVKQREEALKQLKSYVYQDDVLHVQRAFHPDDMIYYNISVTKGDRWKREFLTYVIILTAGVAQFFGIALFRDYQRGWLDSMYNYFLRLLVQFSCYLVMLGFDWCLRPLLYWGVAFEGHKSFSTQEQSWLSKYFVYSLLNKLTIIYSHDFMSELSDLSSPFDKKFDRFIAIFSGDNLWRFGYNQVGNDIFILLIIYVTFSNVLVVAIQYFIKLGMRLAAVSKYDKLQVTIGPNIRWSSLYVFHLVIYTLICAYGFEQPYIMLLGIAYFIVHSVFVRWLMMRYSRLPPRMESVCRHAERIESYISIFSLLAIAQYNYGGKSYIWLLLIVPMLAVYFFLNSSKFTTILKYFLPQEIYELSKFKHSDEIQYKIDRNPEYSVYEQSFPKYVVPSVLTEEESRHMFNLMAGIKQGIQNSQVNGHNRTASERSIQWSSQESRVEDYMIAQPYEGSNRSANESSGHALPSSQLRMNTSTTNVLLIRDFNEEESQDE